uniref:2-(3-amino-3-carboxypropyl)histidine synthase subunit 2 n=1 Tax=Kalmanozyma brasiliensis (strain GHG001) TaxID=1365824 RepID=V5EPN6_KALBG
MAAFSTTDEAVLTAPLELNPLAQSATASSSGRSIYHIYDIVSTAAKIHSGRFQRVALQFPDEALIDSVPVYWALKREVRTLYAADPANTNAASTSTAANKSLPEFYILADTSYGGCCVDEVAAKHVDADLVVHYGHACLSATARLPVIYVFTKQPLADVSAAARSLAEQAKQQMCNGAAEGEVKAIVLTYDVSWDHVVEDVFQATQQALKEQGVDLPLVRTYVDFSRNYDDKLVTLPPSTTFSECLYLYLGPESLSLTNLLLTLGPSTPLISYNPLTASSRIETGSTNRLLMKRYTSVLKARDASVVGLLVGTLGVHSYLPLLKYLRRLLTGPTSGRKVYTISVGKLNPAKLANFQEIDVFVLVACPENTLVDSKEFFRPIVTPFEMELAVRAAERMERGEEGVDWTGRYVLDLERLVPEEERMGLEAKLEELKVDDGESGNVKEDEEDADRPHFSLISGTYVHRRKFNAKTGSTPQGVSAEEGTLQISNQAGGDGDKVVVRNPTTGQLTTVLETASIAHLQRRGWKGLEQRLGMDEPSELEEGREGIAKGYKDAGGAGEIM